MPESGNHEKRRHFRGKPRAGRRVDLRYRRVDADARATVTAVTRNIGVGGAYILTHEPEKVGARLHVELLVPGTDQPITVQADVRWVAPSTDETGQDDEAGMGVHFLEVDVDVVLRLNEFFATLTESA